MTNRVKVAHVATTVMSLRYLLLRHLVSLQQAGYEVVGVSSPGPDIPSIEAVGIRHIAVPMSRSAMTPLADLRALYWLYRTMRRERFTIVHTHTPKAGLLGRWAAKLARVPVIVHTNHGFIFHEGSNTYWRALIAFLERLAASCCDLILSVNHEDIETATRMGICNSAKLMPLGNGGMGVDVGLFDPSRFSAADLVNKRRELGLPSDAKVVGFVGRLVREKGLLELFSAIRVVAGLVPGVRLLIVGPVDSAKPDAVSPEAAREYGISDICVFTGLRQDTPELYAIMDIFVLPSHREGFSLALAEASAMGVPVVATNIRGCREAVQHDRNGLLVPLGNVQALADAIMHLLTNTDEARQMGQRGRYLAIESFDERKVFEKIGMEYTRLLLEKGQVTREPELVARNKS